MNLRYKILLLCGFLWGSSLLGCSLILSSPVEGERDFFPLSVLESYDDGVVLDVSGFSAHSAQVISRVVSVEKNKSINLKVYMLLAGVADKKSTGSLNYRLHVPDSVDTVTIGTKKDVIWSRKEGRVDDKSSNL